MRLGLLPELVEKQSLDDSAVESPGPYYFPAPAPRRKQKRPTHTLIQRWLNADFMLGQRCRQLADIG